MSMSNNCDSPFNTLFNKSTNLLNKIALIIVDFQNDFIFGSLSTINSPSKKNAVEIVSKINSILGYSHYFEKVIISKDWHPNDHISFHSSRHCYAKYAGKNFTEEKIKNANLLDLVTYTFPSGVTFDQQLWPDHCIQNTFGSEIHKDLAIPSSCELILKGINSTTDNYSAFNDQFSSNNKCLKEILMKSGIQVLLICGIALDYCVSKTAIDSKALGYETILITDCCARLCKDPSQIYKELLSKGITLATSEEIIEVIDNCRYK